MGSRPYWRFRPLPLFFVSETKLDEIGQEIEALTAKAKDSCAELTDESREKFDQAVASLKEQKQTALEKLEELKDARADTWKTAKASFDDAMSKLEESFESVKERFDS